MCGGTHSFRRRWCLVADPLVVDPRNDEPLLAGVGAAGRVVEGGGRADDVGRRRRPAVPAPGRPRAASLTAGLGFNGRTLRAPAAAIGPRIVR
jgi:hypothetical protein